MPELPEVETIRRQLDRELKGYSFVSVKTDWEKSFRPSFDVVAKTIPGRKIKAVDRQAKLLIFHLPGGLELLFHLKLTGQLLVRRPSDPHDEFTRSVFTLSAPPVKLRSEDSGSLIRRLPESGRPELRRLQRIKELRFADARKFGYVKLITDRKEMEELLKGYGPEPFKDLNLANFTQILKSSGRPVKTVLLDQAKISGVGNIYANDALWRAKVSPKVPANKLVSRRVGELYEAILEVLKQGLKYGGASDQWYVQTHGEKGKYQEHFLVYGQKGEKCQRCGTEIKRVEIGGRGTFICPACQRK